MSESYSAVPHLVVDGQALDPALEPLVARVEVDERDTMPTMLTVVLRDGDRDVLDRAGLVVGARVEVRAGSVGEPATAALVLAEVLTVEVSYSERSSTVTVRGYDLSHRLHRHRRTRSWEDVTDGDVVRRVAEHAGLEIGTVDDPGVVHQHLGQVDLTDWDFVVTRARDAGRVLRVDGERVELVAPEQASGGPEPGRLSSHGPGQLVLGAGLEAFEARLSAAEVPAEVEVRGWTSETKQPVVASATVRAPGVDLALDPGSVAAGSAVRVVADRTVTTQEEADALATSLAARAGGSFVGARATCRGDPDLHVGRTVSVALVGSLFSGRWCVMAACHTFDGEGYRTALVLGGATSGDGSGAVRPQSRRGTDGGPVVGVVTDTADPAGRGRVRVNLPWLSDDYVSAWARLVVPGGGPDRGLLLVPEVDDEVLVAFEQGDEGRPYVLGGLHNGQDPAPLSGGDVDEAEGEVRRRGLVSRLGHEVSLDDGTDAPGIVLVTGKENVRITLDDRARSLTVETAGDVTVTAGGEAAVTGRTVRVTGDQEVSLSAPSVSVEADSTLTLRGGVVKIN